MIKYDLFSGTCGRGAVVTEKGKSAKTLFINDLALLESTRSRGRTGTTLLSLVFETNASTDSAIRAYRMSKIRESGVQM